ncbi:MAG: hypothetical protein O9341_24525 [Paucibacter sp.]|nr:hypothetical protein [Roseateles sp.]
MLTSQHPKRSPLIHGFSALLILSAGLLPAAQAASVKPKAAAAATASAATNEVELRFFPLPQQRHQIHSVMRMKMDMRMEPFEGMSEEERAKMEQAMQAAKMPMSMRSEFDQQVTTTAADKQGNFQLQLRGKSLPLEMSNAAGERVGPPKATVDIKIDAKLNQKTGSFQSMKMAGMDAASSGLSDALLKQLLSSMSALEGRRLKVGESTEMPLDMALPIPKGPGMDLKMLGRYTLVKLENGVADFDVGVNITMAMSDDKAEAAVAAAAAASSAASTPDAAASAPAAPLMTAAGQGQGRMSLRVADRLVLNQAMNLAMNMRMQAPGKPVMNMKLDMEMEASGKNLKR